MIQVECTTYSGKLSREKTFTNLAVLWPFVKVFFAKFGSVVSFGTAQASNPRTFFSWISSFSPICESFLPQKYPAIRHVPVYVQYIPHMCTWYIQYIYSYFFYFLCRLFESPSSVRLGMVSLIFHVVTELSHLWGRSNYSFYRCVTCFLFWMLPTRWRTRISNQIESHAHSRCGPFA